MEDQQHSEFRQPNLTFRSPDDLNERDREHFEVARSLSGSFEASQFRERYGTLYPSRKQGSIIPSDYCFNHGNAGNRMYPRFLLSNGHHRYTFVGLNGKALDLGVGVSTATGDELHLVTSSYEIRSSLEEFNRDAADHLTLVASLITGSTYWVFDPATETFGPSKFVAFKGMSYTLYEQLRELQRQKRKPPGFDGATTRKKISRVLRVKYESDESLAQMLASWAESILGNESDSVATSTGVQFARLPEATADEQKVVEHGVHDLDSARQPTADPAELDKRVLTLLEGRISRPEGNTKPERAEGPQTAQYKRLPPVKAWVLQEANGECELCCDPAPFYRDDGSPFLEVHHLRTLADEGPDIVENAVALCPNCHRLLHHGSAREQKVDVLYGKVTRLVRP